MLKKLHIIRYSDSINFKIAIGNNGDYLLDLKHLETVFPDGGLSQEQKSECVYKKDHVLVPDYLPNRA